ncbi:hypothetical protein GGP41_010598 [Bipolaris sorokiniana]|uniref:SMP-LTD domain-containing protein n=1 Tax=Cochliobolus sativus TaxID=45130 RepID=A0A8H5ZNH3_COCSA|nr:hypothetical protein GGP41_010598 [Bipolaris sorokiniana]
MGGDWGYGTVFNIFIWGYLVGGLTLLPALLTIAWFWCTTPVEHDILDSASTQHGQASQPRRTSNGSVNSKGGDDTDPGAAIDDEILEKLKGRTHEPDVCAGYFAVCRDYVPGGVNGKPPDRTTPAGTVVAVESPSVYQSMYRSIFDRNKTTSPTIDAANNKNKKARNVFYVVLRLGHLMLYDNEDQIEVRHVISLAHYQVDIYGGGERIPEGELWIKRNCIRLVQQLHDDSTANPKQFFLFSDNCSEKEDFYHAMLHAQENQKDPSDTDSPSVPLKFETPDLVKLVQQLHASEENLHTRWINALIGRVFLAMYKTSQIKEFIAAKINKKISRVPKPAIISSVQLRKVDMGTLPPFITNPKLKELTVDGDLVVEADVSYKGNFSIEVSATVRIDLGTRFKAREVTLILATVLKRLDGHILIRIKPPPSNRLWMTFETPPKMEFSLEPIVSSRQITYGVVLRAIESRIREVVNETLVLPNWDDMPFTDTIAQVIRGGIWEDTCKTKSEDADKAIQKDATLDAAISDMQRLDEKGDSASAHFSISSSAESEEVATGISTSADHTSSSSSIRPRTMRSTSSMAQVKVDSANASAETAHEHGSTPTSARSLPVTTPLRSPMRPSNPRRATQSSVSSSEDASAPSVYAESTAPPTSEGPNLSVEALQEPRLQAPTSPSISKSHTEPMGRGQPLPPPGTPLPLPKNDKRQTWAIPAAATSTFANLTKRKPVAASPPLSSKKSVEDLDSPRGSFTPTTLLPAAHFPGQDARPAAEDGEEIFREMRRRTSSAASELATVPPPLPKRRGRQPSVNQNAHNWRLSPKDDVQGEPLFVVEAPVAEGSAEPSPVRGDMGGEKMFGGVAHKAEKV